jgi:colanic acid/amylovoran biosynthesis protein
MTSKKSITIGLLWHSLTSGNLGVGALTESNIAIIRTVAERLGIAVNFLILGTGATGVPELTAELNQAGHTIECHRIRILRSSYRALVKRCDLVIDIGEGDSFSDIYGFKRFFYYWLSKNIVCTLGIPLILAPQTIGPFDGTVARVLAKQIMARCHKVFSRDHLSTQYLKDIGITGNTAEAIDVAFRLPYQPTTQQNTQVKVGINVSGLLLNGGYTGNNQFGLTIDYAKTIRQIITYFVAQPNVQIHLVAHVLEPNMPVEDDLLACQRLAKEFPTTVLAPAFKRPSEVKSYIAGMDFFIGARMHACIAAFSSGVPVVPMAYSRKFNGLFGSLGYHYLADCKVDHDVVVMQKITAAFESRGAVKVDVANAKFNAENKLKEYEIALSQLVMEIINGGAR